MHDMLTIDIEVHGNATVVVAAGDLDLHTSSTFVVEVLPLARTAGRLVLDFSRIGFIDSSGIGAVVQVKKLLADRRLGLHVVPSNRVRAALKLAGLIDVVVVHAGVGDALAAPPSAR